MVDRKRPFKAYIPTNLIDDFEKAAMVERRLRRQCRPDDLGDLAFLFKES
jgi:hypothetical protein